MGDLVELLSVCVAEPAPLGPRGDQVVLSGIAKQPVVGVAAVELSETNLAGDRQADLTVHGGPDKAVYAYPAEHLPDWRDELGEDDLGLAPFGENLSTSGVTEADVRIGDRWAWGDALFEVCQPRSPCFKLALHRARGDIARRLTASGRTGWYLRVLRPGIVPVAGPVEVVEHHRANVTVLDAHRAMADRDLDDRPLVERVAALAPTLAEEWRAPLVQRLLLDPPR